MLACSAKPRRPQGIIVKAMLAAAFAGPILSACIVTDVAGVAVGATGAVVGRAVDMVTTSKDEQNAKDVKRLKRENKELKRQAADKKDD